jgi:hypothetical protein
MARARNIKPGFFTNELLGESDPLHSLLFIGLWLLADREGRLEDRPVRIRSSIMPLRFQVDADAILSWLHENQFITRYEIKGKKYIQIENFGKHQQPHYKEVASEIPPPPGRKKDRQPSTNVESTSVQRQVNVGSTSAHVRPTKSLHDPLIPDSLIPSSLIPDSLIPDTLSPELSFGVFWSDWPKKVARGDALKAWNKLAPSVELAAIILADVARRKQSPDWHKENGKYIPHPATYLNGRRWEDEGVKLSGEVACDPLADEIIRNSKAFLSMGNGGDHDS